MFFRFAVLLPILTILPPGACSGDGGGLTHTVGASPAAYGGCYRHGAPGMPAIHAIALRVAQSSSITEAPRWILQALGTNSGHGPQHLRRLTAGIRPQRLSDRRGRLQRDGRPDLLVYGNRPRRAGQPAVNSAGFHKQWGLPPAPQWPYQLHHLRLQSKLALPLLTQAGRQWQSGHGR